MSTDRQLLEDAARAAGQERSAAGDLWSSARGMLWNPLTNDGDALRLASALRLRISMDYEPGMIGVEWFREFGLKRRGGLVCQSHGEDRNAALLRAIVRAAAEIGKARRLDQEGE